MAEQTKQALKVENNTNFPNNNTGYITPALLREFNTDMIDSTVNQIAYTADSASFNDRIDGFTPVATGSLLVTASAAGNTITFTKGDGSTFGVTTSGGGGDVTALNAYTSSNNAWWAALNPKTGSYAVTGSSVLFTNVTASFFRGDGSALTNVTASFTGVPISNDGVPQGTASTLNFTGSAVNASVIGGIALITVDSIGTASFNSFTQSVNNGLSSLNAFTASVAGTNAFTASIRNTNTFTASAQLEINALEAFTSSIAGTNAFTASIRNTNTFTASAQLEINALESFTASVAGTNAFTASIAATNAFTQSTNTSIATINNAINALNGFTASNDTYALDQWTGSINTFTASIAGTNTFTQSAQVSINALNAATSSYAKTNVNNQFTTDQTITGSLVVTGTITANKLNVIIESSSVIYSSGSNIFGDELTDTQILSGSVKVVGGLTVNGLNVVTGAVDTTALNQATASLQAFTASVAGTNAFTQSANQRLNSIEAQSGSWVTSAITASVVKSIAASPTPNTIEYTLGNGTTNNITLNIAQTDVTALNQATASLNAFTASVAGTNTFTASVAGTNAFTQSASGRLNALEATTASLNTSVANLNTFSASALTTASVNLNTITFTKGNGSTFAVTVNTGSGGPSTDISALNAFTASVAGTNAFTASIAGTNAFTQSAQNSLNSLNAATSSYITSAVTSSMAVSSSLYSVTASYALNTATASYVTGSKIDINYIDFNTGSATPDWKSGRVFWDNTDGCLAVYNAEADVTLQVGQENWTRVYNGTGVAIANGVPVRLSGTHGDVPEVVLAQSVAISGSANNLNQILGLATHTIEAGTFGYITTQGLVRGLNTNAFTDGATLYVSTTAGVLSTTPPATPYEKIPIGQCVKAGPGASGIIYVAVEQPVDFSDLSSVNVGVYSNGDLWRYEGTGSTGAWYHRSPLQAGLATTGSNTFNGDQIISGSTVITGNLNVFGSASFTTVTSSVYIGGNRILLNTFTPSVRYGGMEVIDSGSTGLTGSLLWDSQNDVWIYVNPSGSSYASARLISGPKSATLGSEPTLTQNRIPKADDGDHIVDSQISDDGTTVTIANAISASTFVGLGNLTSYSASVDSRINGIVVPSLTPLNQFTASIAGTNAFTASALVTASATLNTITFSKGDGTTFAVTVNTGSAGGGASFPYTGSAVISGSLGVTGSISVVSSSFSGAVITNLTDIYTDVSAVQQIVTLTSASYAALASGSATNPNTLYIVSGSTSGTGTDITALNAATASLQAFTASIAGTNAFTASTTLRLNSIESKTGSFATTGSNLFVGDQTITGSLILSSSAATELTVIGNSIFSGSVQGRVLPVTITANTASLDFSQGNFFTLALAATVGTHISASNVQPGETVSIRITQNATPGTVTYPPAMKFASGSAYTASTTAGAVDIITFISYDNATVYASSVKNMI